MLTIERKWFLDHDRCMNLRDHTLKEKELKGQMDQLD
jgi:hypothetical protein